MLDNEERFALLQPPTGPVRVVIDTDLTNEIDDEFALVWALLSQDQLQIEAVYAAPHALWPELLETGVSTLDKRLLLENLEALGIDITQLPATDPADGVAAAYDEAVAILDLLQADIPVFHGAEGYFSGPDSPPASEAADDLIARARTGEGPLYVVSLGAPTNVAAALQRDPEIARHLVVLWTSAYPSYYPYPNASFNLAQDPDAVRVILDSGVPLVYLPGFYVGEELRVTQPEIDTWVHGRGVAGDYLHTLYGSRLALGDPVGRSKVIWDLIALAWLVDPDLLQTRLVFTPSLQEDLRWGRAQHARWMREAEDVDRDGLFRDLYQKLAVTEL